MSADVRENRLRRVAKRRGIEIIKSRRRDPAAIGYGLYHLKELHGSRVFGCLSEGGRGFRDAPARHGGALRFACWMPLDRIEVLLDAGLTLDGLPVQVVAKAGEP